MVAIGEYLDCSIWWRSESFFGCRCVDGGQVDEQDVVPLPGADAGDSDSDDVPVTSWCVR